MSGSLPGVKSLSIFVLLQILACQSRSGTDAKTVSESIGPNDASSLRWATSATSGTTATNPAPSANTAPATSAATSVGADPSTQAGAFTEATPAARAGDSDSDSVPPLTDENGNPLPQTDVEPSLASPSFQRRLDLLVQAIAKDEPKLAVPSFFPVEAYKQVKAIAKPEQDWKRRLLTAFERNIHEYHRQLGGAAAGVRFARLELPAAKVKWMKPGSEGNRVGYFRALRSKLIVTKSDGREATLEVTSMISWRGEWYVVHLHGFE